MGLTKGESKSLHECAMSQEASKTPYGKKKPVSAGSIDAASTAQFVRHLEEDPLIQAQQNAGALPMTNARTQIDNLTNGSSTPSPLTSLQLPMMNEEVRSRIMSMLWANWEVIVSAHCCNSPCVLWL